MFWAGNFTLGRIVHGEIPPITLNFWRWTIACLVLLPLAAREAWVYRGVIARAWKLILALSILGVAGFNSFVYVALNTTTSLNATLMLALVPVVTPFLSFAHHGERITLRQALGIVVSLLGAAIIITQADLDVLILLQFTEGDIWMLGAVFSWALYSVLLRHRPADLPALAFLIAITVTGIPILLPMYLWELTAVGGFALNIGNALTIAYVALFASVLAYICWNRGVAHTGAIKAGLFMHLVPVFGAILAIVVLGERLQPYHFMGVPLIIIGIILTTTTPGMLDRSLRARQ